MCIVNCELQNRKVILLVEDNVKLNDANSRAFKLSGYEVHTALTIAEARAALTRITPDVILLDVMLPDGDGFDFCEEIRRSTQAHILFLTAKTEQEDMIRGLMTGGDDYLMKPFHPEALIAKVASAMRRREMDKIPAKTLSIGNLTLDFLAVQAFVDGVSLLLTTKQFALLRLLAENENKTVTMEALYEEAWKEPMAGYHKTLRRHISELRNKLTENGCSHTVRNIYGKGYRFERA